MTPSNSAPNEQGQEAFALTRRRAEAVAIVSSLTAKALKVSQAIAGVEMEVLRLELEIDRNPADRKLVQELHDTEESAAAMRETLAECAGEIEAAEEDVAALDHLIAVARGG